VRLYKNSILSVVATAVATAQLINIFLFINIKFMKKKILLLAVIAASLAGGIIIAADHIDAPSVTGSGSVSLGTDITDV